MSVARNLIVKRSTLPESGKGLFTKSIIHKNTKVIEYRGKITTWKEVDHDDGNNPYIFYVNRNHVIDAKNNKAALARYANDARGLRKIKNTTNNSEYIIENKKVFIKALKDIPAGSEIFVGYGKEYWSVIKENNRAERKKTPKKKS